ncbi:MAG TPA: SusC/RagA family TonB-linked outer membrane protein, partial [Chitinophagaceae bacterium]|nr:SusC/RagA family TonB-linked outer membrane protein [Chitinophagaceae bacterium]
MRSIIKRFLYLLILFFSTFYVSAQTTTVKGKVIAEDGTPVSRASISVKNTNRGTVSADDGSFSIDVQGRGTLVISALGYANREMEVSGGEVVDIRLSNALQAMDEVVVTALGIRREKRQLTYSTQEVKGDVLMVAKEPNVLNAMTGRVAGVQITSSTGAPGSSSRIVIRGTSSLLGENQALIVLDGVPIDNSETGNAGPGAGVSRLSDIDPSIIESINVLKGSAASALYGSRAARGVVMITTKNGGAVKKPTITFSSQVSFETPILPEVQEKYAQGENGVFFNGDDRKTSLVWGPRIDTLRVNGSPVFNRNPMKDFFQTGKTYTNTISVGGGSDRANYFLSYSYLDQKGTVPETDFKRHALFAKYGARISDKFNTNFQFNYTTSLNNRVPEGYDLVSPIWTIYTAPFTYNPLPYLDQAGNQRVFRFSRNNPYWVLDNIHNDSRINRFIPVATLAYTPTSWLTITERLGADIYAEQAKYFEAPSNTLATTGIIRDRNNNFRQFNHDLIVEGRKNFGTDLNISLLIGNNLLSTYSQGMQIEGTGITIANFYNVSNSDRQVSSESYSLQRKVGFYAQSNLEYKRFLNLSLTGRYDGSSVLSKE